MGAVVLIHTSQRGVQLIGRLTGGGVSSVLLTLSSPTPRRA